MGILPTRTMRTLTAGIALVIATAISAVAQVNPALFEELRWREIGPFRGGRSCAVAGTVQRPDHFFMGATGGGVWKTEDAGQTWRNVSDGYFATGSVGSIDVSRSNHDIVYVGMGETELRGNVSHGDSGTCTARTRNGACSKRPTAVVRGSEFFTSATGLAVIGIVQGSPFRPTDQAVAVFEELSRLLDAELAKLNSALTRELAALNNELTRVALDPVSPRPRDDAVG